jgi:hypothetical protein
MDGRSSKVTRTLIGRGAFSIVSSEVDPAGWGKIPLASDIIHTLYRDELVHREASCSN